MPKFYFNIYDGEARAPDEEGCEFVDFEAAKEEALNSLRDLVAEAVKNGNRLGGFSIEICDAGGNVLETVRARQALN